MTHKFSAVVVVCGGGDATACALNDKRDDILNLGLAEIRRSASSITYARAEDNRICNTSQQGVRAFSGRNYSHHRGLKRLYAGPSRRTRRPIMTKLAASSGVGAIIVVTIL